MAENPKIVGCIQTGYCRQHDTLSLPELVYTCSKGLLDKYGLERSNLDQVIIAADDLLDGVSISSMVTAAPTGGLHKEFMKIAGDGSFAFSYAYMCIKAGLSDLILVIGWSKISDAPFNNVKNLTFDPFYLRPFFDEISSKALQAGRYQALSGVTPIQAAMVSVKNRSNACRNPVAHLREEINIDDVLSSEIISNPIKSLDNSTLSEGACAVLIASEKRAEAFQKPVCIKGIAWNVDSYHLGDRELSELPSLKSAALKAYEMAGVKNPMNDIDVAEISDISSYHELMMYEASGFCGKGEGGEFMKKGYSRLDGALPVNPSGGLISSNPGTAAGLARIAECYLQICGEAGDRQVKNANVAMAHGIQGNACQANCVIILGK